MCKIQTKYLVFMINKISHKYEYPHNGARLSMTHTVTICIKKLSNAVLYTNPDWNRLIMAKRLGHSLTFMWPIFSCWSYCRDILETIIFESHCLSKIAKKHAISHLFSRRKSCLFANLYKNSCALEVCRKICKSFIFNLLLQYYKISFINKYKWGGLNVLQKITTS